MSLQRLRLIASISEAYPNIQYFEEFQSSKKYKNEDFEQIIKFGGYGYTPQLIRQYFPEFTRQYLQIFKKNCGMTLEQYYQIQVQYYQQQYLQQQQQYIQQQSMYQNQQQYGYNNYNNPNIIYNQNQNYYPNNQNNNRYNKNSFEGQNNMQYQSILDTQQQVQQQSFNPESSQKTPVIEHPEQKQQSQSIMSKKKSYIEKKQSNTQIVSKQQIVPPRPQKFTLEEVKNFINGFGKQNIKGVNEQLIKSVSAMNNWNKREEVVEIQNMEKLQKTNSKNQDNKYNNRPKRTQPTAPVDGGAGGGGFNIGDKRKQEPSFQLILGANETLEQRVLKKQLAEKASKRDYEKQKELQVMNKSQVEKAERQIIFNLNLLAPQNLRGIQADLKPFLIHSQEFCQVLIQQIIQKAWQQPKYSSTYALLCKYFSNVPLSDFNFDIDGSSGSKTDREKKSKSNNPFKFFLIEKVQHTFDRKHQNLQFKSEEQKQNYLKVIKKKIIGNVKFIAELILNKVLKKRIAKYCTTQLIITFLTNHYYYVNTNKFEYSFYDYYMEAVIEFIENLSERFETLDDQKQKKQEKKEQKKLAYTYDQVLKIVQDLISCKKEPVQQYPELDDIKVNEYFKLFMHIDEKILSKKNNRLSSLLKNLEERRDNGWQRHHVQAEGPKKLKDVGRQQQETTKTENKKTNFQELDEGMKILLKQYQQNDKWQKKFTQLSSFAFQDFITSYLKQFAQQKKQNVSKRIQFFAQILTKNKFHSEKFKSVWPTALRSLAFLSSDLPYCGAGLAKILLMIDESRGIRLNDYFIKFDEQEEDEQFFMNQVYQKLYHYSKKQEIKSLVDTNEKISGLL